MALSGTALAGAGALALKKRFGKNKKRKTSHKINTLQTLRQAPSFTKTKTKTENDKDLLNNIHSATDGRQFTVILKSKTPKHSSASWKFTQTMPGFFSDTGGRQSVTDHCGAGTLSQHFTNTGMGYDNFQAAVSLQSQNPYVTNTGGHYGSSVNPLTDRYLYKSVQLKTDFSNNSSAACTVTLYYLTPKQPCDKLPSAMWIASNISMGLGDAIETLPTAAGVVGTAGHQSIFEVYAQPTEGKLFNEYYKIRKKLTLRLAGAAQECVQGTFIINDIVKREKATELTAQAEINWRSTIYVMVVVHGQVVENKLQVNKPTYCPTEIFAITHCQYKCHAVDGNAGRLNASLHSYNVGTGGTTANVSTINILDVVTDPQQT